MKTKPAISPLSAHLGYWMRMVSNHVSHSFSRKLEAQGVTVAEWVVLRELYELGETNPSTLADSLGLTRGAISKLIERLVIKELVNRVSSDEDRRYQSIALTEAGHAIVPQLAALADQNDVEFFGRLSPSQRETLLEMLQELAAEHQLKTPPTD